jgi:hypothetical protein
MRGALQARNARLSITIRGLSWPSRPDLRTPRPSQVAGEELEIIERLSTEQRRARRSGGYAPEAVLRRHWR